MMALWSRHDAAQHDEQRAALRTIFEERCKPDQPVAFADFELMAKEVSLVRVRLRLRLRADGQGGELG